MEIKAYALVKNEVMIGKFFDTKRSVEETYAKKLEDPQYSIGVFTFAGETEIVEESEWIELYTSYGGYLQWKKGWSLNADTVKDRYDEKYREGDYIFKIQKKYTRKNSFWGGYVIDNAEHIDIIKPYKKPKPVEEEVKEETEDLVVDSKSADANEQPQQSDDKLRTQLQRYIHSIQPLPDLRPIARAMPRPRIVAEEMRVAPEGIIIHTPMQYTTRPSSLWIDCLLGTDSVMKESDEKSKVNPFAQVDEDCPF